MGKQTSSEYPSVALIWRLAVALDSDEEELVLMAQKIPGAAFLPTGSESTRATNPSGTAFCQAA